MAGILQELLLETQALLLELHKRNNLQP